MRDYQRLKNNVYQLPHNVWRATLYIIRDYYRLKEMAEDAADLTSVSAEGGHSSMPGDSTASKAMQLERYMDKVRAIDKAKATIPPEYARGVWDNILYGTPYPMDADRSTYSRHKSRFVYTVARNLDLL